MQIFWDMSSPDLHQQIDELEQKRFKSSNKVILL